MKDASQTGSTYTFPSTAAQSPADMDPRRIETLRATPYLPANGAEYARD